MASGFGPSPHKPPPLRLAAQDRERLESPAQADAATPCAWSHRERGREGGKEKGLINRSHMSGPCQCPVNMSLRLFNVSYEDLDLYGTIVSLGI